MGILLWVSKGQSQGVSQPISYMEVLGENPLLVAFRLLAALCFMQS